MPFKEYRRNPLRILFLEDDHALSEIIEEFLTELGYDVSCVYDGRSAFERGYEERYDLFLFDVKVPSQNGFDVLKMLRENGKETPAIFITSLSSVEDMSMGFEVGCDDYLKKPFELKELELRIKSLTRRLFYHRASERIEVAEGIVFDLNKIRLFKGAQEMMLARKEAQILRTLLIHPGEIVSSEKLIASAWEYGEEPSEESLRTHIKNLRKILGKEAIVNIRGQGYQLAQP